MKVQQISFSSEFKWFLWFFLDDEQGKVEISYDQAKSLLSHKSKIKNTEFDTESGTLYYLFM